MFFSNLAFGFKDEIHFLLSIMEYNEKRYYRFAKENSLLHTYILHELLPVHFQPDHFYELQMAETEHASDVTPKISDWPLMFEMT